MGEQVGQRGVDDGHPGGGEPHDDAPPVGGVGLALDVAAGDQPVDPVGHRAAGDQGLGDELARAELVRRAGAAQGRQHVELPAVEPVLGERGAAGPVEAAGQPRHAGEHLEGADVEVGTLAAPRGDDTVDIVSGHAADSTAHQVS